jgi:acetyl esterase/lipase
MQTTSFQSTVYAEPIALQVFGTPALHKQPVMLFFHGGLFNCGQVESAHDVATALSEQAIVVCVDYPLAPRLQFPQTIEVAYEALDWVSQHASSLGADVARVFVGGEQAGGNLAAVVAMLFRDRGLGCKQRLQLRGQILINPMLDALQTSKSMAAAVDSPCRQAWADYIQVGSHAIHPYVSPVNSCRLANLAPALVMTSESHPLRDEAEAYATKLLLAGVPVQVRRLADSALPLSAAQHPAFGEMCQLIRQCMMT